MVYDLKVTNLGLDTVTDVRFIAAITFSFISVTSSVDKCLPNRHSHWKLAKIDKGESVTIKTVEKEEWSQQPIISSIMLREISRSSRGA